MRKLLFLLLVSTVLKAQNSVNVSLIIPSPYSQYFNDYTQFVGQNVLTLTNTTNNTQQVKLLGSIEGLDNGLFVRTLNTYTPANPILLAPNQVYSVTAASPSRNFLDINNTENNISEQQQLSIAASGMIPEGTYRICVAAYDYATNEPLSSEGAGCAIVSISYPVPPILLVPTCHSSVVLPLPSFSWTGVFSSGVNFLYDLYLLKLSEGQIPDDAMWLAISSNVGNPIKISNIQSTGYQYKVSDIPLQYGAKYAWCVVAREQTGKLKIGNQGRSEVCTFDFQPAGGPVILADETNGPSVIDTFNLNNTSISGRIMYRYYNDENFTNVSLQPAYNPTISVGGTAMNALELAQSPAGSSGRPSGNATNGIDFNQILVSGNTTDRSTIKIDPSKKYLYENTLSNNGSDPLRNTELAVYLEYVAVTKNWSGNAETPKEHFQVVPGMEMFYERSCQNTMGACIDPQMTFAAQQAGIQTPTFVFQHRSLGSELLGSAVTDENGNFTFDFDLAENTGLLEREENLMKMEFVAPDFTLTPEIDMGMINPEAEVANPADNFSSGFNNFLSGNSMLQGNQGWGGNNSLINGIGGMGSQTPGQNLQMDMQQGPGGPSMPDLFTIPNEDPLNECTPYTAEFVFKVLRIKVMDPLYASPDILIFAQPGESLVLPTVSTFVNSFDVEYSVVAGGLEKDKDILLLQPNQPISNIKVLQGRTSSFWSSKPDNFPLHEGMDINPAGSFSIESETPYFQSGNINRPSALRLTAFEQSNTDGKLTLKKLIPKGTHYFKAEVPLTATYNYTNTWGSILNEAQLPYNLSDAVHSFSFRPELLKRILKLDPLNPEILVRVMTQSNLQNRGLKDVNVALYSYHPSPSNLDGYYPPQFALTDTNGYYRFTNLPVEENENGQVMARRKILFYKEGYKSMWFPAMSSDPAFDKIPALKKGQRFFTNEVLMEGGTSVYGFVRDEDGNSVTALVQIEDGAYHITENVNSGTLSANGYGNPLRRSVPEEEIAFNPVTVGSGIFSGFSFGAPATGSNQNSNARTATTHSRFSMKAPALGPNTRVIIQPLSEQYFADTFYVSIPAQNTTLNIGTFVVLEKLHRVKVIVKYRQPTPEMAQGARVEIGENVKNTNASGVAYFKFPTPDAYFRVYIKDGNRIPIEEYKYLPVSKRYISLEYTTQPGMSVSGKVTDAQSGQPLANARIFYQSTSNEYGAVLTETFSDASGNYTLQGLPTSAVTISCSANHPDLTYIGSQQGIANPAYSVSNINFALNRFAGGSITKIWGFPVELQSALDLGNGKYRISGALVKIPENPNFAFDDSLQRVRFANVIVVASGQQNAQGQPILQPEQDNFITQEAQLRLRLKNVFYADLKGKAPNNTAKIEVLKQGNSGGALAGKVKTDLESFRFSFDYDGAFYLGESIGVSAVNALVSNPQTLSQRDYFLMDLNAQFVPKTIAFSVHGFQATADSALSKLRNDTFIVKTRLHPNIPLSKNVTVDAGNIRVHAQGITIPQTGENLEFKLEDWTVRSTSAWAFSIPLGGIVIPGATLVTKMANLPVKDLILRPSEILMQQANVDMENLSLGDGSITLNQYANNKSYFYLDPACSGDLKPHWRFDLYNNTSGNPSCYIQGLLGFEPTDKINIGAFTVFSDNNTLVQPLQTTEYVFHKISKVKVHNVSNLSDGLELVCSADMQIPGSVSGTLILSYTKPSQRKIKSFDLYVESKGKVYFNANNDVSGYVFSGNSFVSNGSLHFENDDPNDGKRIELIGILTRKLEGGVYTTEITIPTLLSGQYQKIPLTGSANAYLEVIIGKQEVISGNWDYLRYTADLISEGGLVDNRLDYVVSGAVEVNKDGSNEIAITDVQTPLGALNIVFDWETATFLGTLSVTKTIPIGPSVNLKEGLFEIMFSGDGFYFDVVGKVSITGLEALADLNFGFLTGYHTALPDWVIERHNGLMSIKRVPEELTSEGIKGLYFNVNFSPPAANWSTTIPLALVTIETGVELGMDVAMFLHFGATEKILQIDAGAIATAYVGANVLGCPFCLGVRGIFVAEGKVYSSGSSPSTLSGCASLTLAGVACGASFETTAGCTVSVGGEDSPKLDLQWTPCGTPTSNMGILDNELCQ